MTRNMSQSITPLCTDTGFKTLREYLHASRLTEVEVPKDGLCILHAVHGGLQSSQTSTSAPGLSKEKVKDMVGEEFLQHGEEYMPYSALSKEDTLAQLESWAQTGQYGSDSVDLILHILSQVLNLRILVVEETTSRVTRLELLPHREDKCSLMPPLTSVILIKHGQHFNHTVISRDKEHCPTSSTKVCEESLIDCQSTDVPTTMQQSEAAYQRTDVPTTMQQSATACQRTDVPTTMQQSEAACQRTDVPTTMQQSEAACQTDVPTSMQPAPSAASEPCLDEKTLLKVATMLGPIWVKLAVELGFTMVQVKTIEKNYQNDITRQGLEMLITWKQAQSTSVEQQRTTLCTALEKIGRADVAEFLHGAPAPGPQLSQRPDQEPRLGAPSYQDVGNKTRDILKGVYKTTGSYVQLLPRVDNDQMHIAGIYTKVQLETREGVAVVTGKKGEAVNSTEYNKIFRLRTKTDELIKRLVFFGMGGVGKSTIFDKIAYDWADATSEILNGFKLVFLLKMCALVQESDLVDSTFDQLLPEDSGITKNELNKFIQANPTEVLILLDGFDEMKTKKLNAASFGSILKALNRTVYKECCICVSTRPSRLETLMSKSLVQNPCTHVEVLGFTDDNVKEYVRKFYEKTYLDSGKALIQTIGNSNTLRDFAANPMLLLLMCLLWRESKQLPETTSRLFTKAVNYMFTRKGEDKKRVPDPNVSKTLNAIGQTALRGLMDANQKFSFQKDEFKPKALDLALKAGILTQQRVIKNLESHNNIQFMHKTMQEYCAARYLQSIHMSNKGLLKRTLCKVVPSREFENILRQLCQTIEGVVSNEFLFRFCSGDNEMCMTDIVNLLDRKLNTDESMFQSDIIQAISQNCFFESQSSKVPRCLTSDLHIPSTIEVRSDNVFRSLIYLLEIVCKSDSLTAQLARVKTIQVSRVSRYPVSDLAVALPYMKNLTNLKLEECPLVKGDLEKTMSSICSQHLTNLDIEGCNSLGGRAVEWAPHIKHLASLEKLQIKSCELQGTDIEHIALAVGDMSKLTDLILDENQTLSGSADLWNKEMPTPITQHLKRLNLSKCNLTWKDFEYIASAVGDMHNLTDLILYGNRRLGGSAGSAKKLPKLTHLRRLDLGGSNLETTDIEHIASAVGDIPELTDLGLTFNGTLASSVLLWAKELPKMKHLNRLDLTYCHLKETDIEHIAVAVRDMPGLTDLDLNGNWVFSDLDGLLSRFPSLRGHVKT